MHNHLSNLPQDPYDVAFQWGWETPSLRNLVYLCYKTPNLTDNAHRFFASAEFQAAVQILSTLGKPPSKQVLVLDFGCGNGVACYALARAGYSVIGMDSSLGYLAGLNAAQKIQGLDGITFELRHSVGEKLEFPENTFDVVWIREVLHHVKDLPNFLKSIQRILKPDGIICGLREVVIWNEKQREHFFASHPFNHIVQDEGCYYLSEYLGAFQQAGLRMEKVLDPHASVINTYPQPFESHRQFDENAAKQRTTGYDLFSFFARNPVAIDNSLQTAINYLNTGDAVKALELLDQLREKQSDNPTVMYSQAVALARLNWHGEAIETLRELLEKVPHHTKAQTLLSELQALASPPLSSPPASPRSLREELGTTVTPQAVFQHSYNFYGKVLLTPTTLANVASAPELWNELLSFHHELATDEYVTYLDAYYRESVKRFGKHWWYFDIVNVLFAAAKVLQPRNYLEIGVRRGRSVCMVARGCPDVNIFGLDLWMPNYAGMPNPGPGFVKEELKKHGHRGVVTFIDGDSHQMLPRLFQQYPHLHFDLITVDGDHSEAGALADLGEVVPHLTVGGVIVFDDIAHPAHPYLIQVWRKTLQQFPYLSGFEFSEAGYGVAFAIRTRD